MPFTLQQLSDLEDIKLLKHAYFRCIDTANEAELATLFTDDVTIDLRGVRYKYFENGHCHDPGRLINLPSGCANCIPYRGEAGVDFDAIATGLQRISQLVTDFPEIAEMDINPLVADAEGVVAVDARLTINYPPVTARRYDHMAIHPYPNDLVKQLQLPDGTDIVIRPIRPEDAEMEQEFVRNLSKESRYMRFMQALRELTPDMLVRLTQIDYDREMAFLALTRQDGKEVEMGVTRYAINPDRNSCEFALVIADEFQNRGLGGVMMNILIDTARARGLRYIDGEVLAHNHGMLKLMQRLGFERQKSDIEDGIVVVRKRLG
jgi:acetyltransferase